MWGTKYRRKYLKEYVKPELDGSIWNVGYFSSTIGLNEELIQKYIEYQGQKDLPEQAGFEFS